jgi:uncharacterized membrane protein
MASVCLIPFATGFLFKFYNYTNVNLFFSLLVLVISLLYVLIFILLIRNNFKGYFDKKDEIKNSLQNDGIELPNLKLYAKGVILTLFYILLAPVGTSLISIGLAFISPLLSVLSFLLTLVFVSVIRMKRISKDSLENVDLTDDEKEFVDNIRKSIYGE